MKRPAVNEWCILTPNARGERGFNFNCECGRTRQFYFKIGPVNLKSFTLWIRFGALMPPKIQVKTRTDL